MYGIVFQPFLGPGNVLKKLFIFGRLYKFGARFASFNPTYGIYRVAINRQLQLVLLLPGQGMDNSQKFANIVGA